MIAYPLIGKKYRVCKQPNLLSRNGVKHCFKPGTIVANDGMSATIIHGMKTGYFVGPDPRSRGETIVQLMPLDYLEELRNLKLELI